MDSCIPENNRTATVRTLSNVLKFPEKITKLKFQDSPVLCSIVLQEELYLNEIIAKATNLSSLSLDANIKNSKELCANLKKNTSIECVELTMGASQLVSVLNSLDEHIRLKSVDIICNFGENYSEICSFLNSKTNLRNLKLDKPYDKKIKIPNANFFENLKLLTTIKLSVGMSLESILSLCKFLRESNTIEKLILGECSIGENIIHLCESLCENKSLKQFDASDNGIFNYEFHYIFDLIKRNSTITDLNLEKNEFGNGGMRQIYRGLRFNNTLKRLNLGKLQDRESALEILESLEKNSGLTEFDFDYCAGYEDVGLALVKTLSKNTTLKKLSMSCINFFQICGLSSALVENAKIKSLSLKDCSIDVVSAKKLGSSKTLRRLTVICNEISDGPLKSLLSEAKISHCLQNLRLEGRISNSGCESISNFLSGNSSLTSLQFDIKRTVETGIDSIFDGLEKNTKLFEFRAVVKAIQKEDTISKIEKFIVTNKSLKTFVLLMHFGDATQFSGITEKFKENTALETCCCSDPHLLFDRYRYAEFVNLINKAFFFPWNVANSIHVAVKYHWLRGRDVPPDTNANEWGPINVSEHLFLYFILKFFNLPKEIINHILGDKNIWFRDPTSKKGEYIFYPGKRKSVKKSILEISYKQTN